MFRRAFISVFRRLIRPLLGKGLSKLPLVMRVYSLLYRLSKPKGLALVEIEGNKIYIDTSDPITSRLLYMLGIYEKGGTDVFKRTLIEGMTVADIGAHIGYYTLLAAKLVGQKGRVFAFEPAPGNYALLVKNIEANGYKNVTPLNKAVSNQSGNTKLFLSPDHNANHKLWSSGGGQNWVNVNMTTIDEFFESYGSKLDFIKMDVEGWEMAVLEGMAKIIDKNPKLKIISEFWPEAMTDAGFSPVEFLNKLLEYGFKLYLVDDHGTKVTGVDALMKLAEPESKKPSFAYIYCARNME